MKWFQKKRKEEKPRLRVLIIGRGGRESALAWKLSKSPLVEKIFVAPGNAGADMCQDGKVSNMSHLKEDDFEGLVELARELKISFVVPGPDAPIVNGIERYFRKANIPCFAPSKETAQLSLKPFAKGFMFVHNIPTAEYRAFSSYSNAEAYIKEIDHKVKFKASGLAAGKGVLFPETKKEAFAALRETMLKRKFRDAGAEVVIEESLEGEELSIMTFSDGKTYCTLQPARTYKQLFNDDRGPNAGGMGCYSCPELASPKLMQKIEKSIIGPTINGLREEGIPFVGMLFTSVVITKTGPKVLEYNASFGDLEAQTLLPRLESDLAEIMVACAEGRLRELKKIHMHNEACVVVMLAAEGYPGKCQEGHPIDIYVEPVAHLDLNFFHAGTRLESDGAITTAGGRVMAVAARGDTLEDAVESGYAGVKAVNFKGKHYRTDIATHALKRRGMILYDCLPCRLIRSLYLSLRYPKPSKIKVKGEGEESVEVREEGHKNL